MMENKKYYVCLSGIAWQQAQNCGLNKGNKNQISVSKITPNSNAEYQFQLNQVSHTYVRQLEEKNHHNDHKPSDKNNNMMKCDDDGDYKGNQRLKIVGKGTDFIKPQMQKKGPKPLNFDNGKALKGFSESWLEA
jgi:hypothetical protein